MNYKQYDPRVLDKVRKVELEVADEFLRICEKYHIPVFMIAGSALGAVRHGGFIPWDDDMDFGMLREDFEKLKKVVEQECEGRFYLTGPDEDIQNKGYNFVPSLSKSGTRFATVFDHGNFNVGIPVDIFVYDYVDNDSTKRKKQMRKCLLWRNLYVFSNVNFFTSHIDGSGSTLKFILAAIIHFTLKWLHISKKWMFRRFLKNATLHAKNKTDTIAILGLSESELTAMRIEDTFPVVTASFEGLSHKAPLVNNVDKLLRNRYGNYMELPPEKDRQTHYPFLLEFEDGEVIKS